MNRTPFLLNASLATLTAVALPLSAAAQTVEVRAAAPDIPLETTALPDVRIQPEQLGTYEDVLAATGQQPTLNPPATASSEQPPAALQQTSQAADESDEAASGGSAPSVEASVSPYSALAGNDDGASGDQDGAAQAPTLAAADVGSALQGVRASETGTSLSVAAVAAARAGATTSLRSFRGFSVPQDVPVLNGVNPDAMTKAVEDSPLFRQQNARASDVPLPQPAASGL